MACWYFPFIKFGFKCYHYVNFRTLNYMNYRETSVECFLTSMLRSILGTFLNYIYNFITYLILLTLFYRGFICVRTLFRWPIKHFPSISQCNLITVENKQIVLSSIHDIIYYFKYKTSWKSKSELGILISFHMTMLIIIPTLYLSKGGREH